MVQWIPDPENTSVMIPRFKDATEMGDYYEKTKFQGKCGADYKIFLKAKEELPGNTYGFAYKTASPSISVSLTLILLGGIILLLYLAVTYIVLPLLSAVAVLTTPGKAEVIDLGPPNCTCPPYKSCPKVVSNPDGSTITIDACTGEVIAKSAAPITLGTVFLYGAVLIGVGIGSYFLYKFMKPRLQKLPEMKKKLIPKKEGTSI